MASQSSDGKIYGRNMFIQVHVRGHNTCVGACERLSWYQDFDQPSDVVMARAKDTSSASSVNSWTSLRTARVIASGYLPL
jgi:hypothetical protein